MNTLYYTDVVKVFMNLPEEISTSLIARDIEFRFKNSENGVRLRDLAIDSGQLVGIMGASGSGKSTLLRLINGMLKQNHAVLPVFKLCPGAVHKD